MESVVVLFAKHTVKVKILRYLVKEQWKQKICCENYKAKRSKQCGGPHRQILKIHLMLMFVLLKNRASARS